MTIGLLIMILILEGIAALIKYYRKHTLSKVDNDQTSSLHDEHEDGYITYYQKAQRLNLFRAVLIGTTLSYIIVSELPHLSGFFAIAAGAITLVFGSYIISMITYFYLISILDIGDLVKIGDYQGELIKMRPLSITLAGKNESGEHTGETIQLPNHKVWESPIRQIDRHLKKYQKQIMTIPCRSDGDLIDFDTFMDEFCTKLDQLIDITTSRKAGKFKSYIGYRYKRSLTYDNEGYPAITLGFICKVKELPLKQRQIVTLVEQIKRSHRLP